MWDRVSDPVGPSDALQSLTETRESCRVSLDLDGSETRPHTDPSLHVFPEFLLGSAVAVEHFLGVIIFHPRLITKDLVVRSFK